MTDEGPGRASDGRAGTRESPVGAPVVRGNEAITGDRADEAVQFDPEDPAAVDRAEGIVREFAEQSAADDNIVVLRGAAACATLVLAEGSYTAAADRAGPGVTVGFVRKWARVHDLPRPVRKHVAMGRIAPTAAKHIARTSGADRYDLAWAALDHDLTVRDIRAIAGQITDDTPIEQALAEHGVDPWTIELSLSRERYRELHNRAAAEGIDPDDLVETALAAYFEE